MKRLVLILLVAIVAGVPQGLAAKRSRAASSAIPFDKLIELLATEAHWDEANLSALGLNKLVSMHEQEEYGESVFFIYGIKTRAKILQPWEVKLTSRGRHAFAIEVALDTDNGTVLYFKEKADHDTFMTRMRQSSHYTRGEYYDSIGQSIIMGDEYKNGWYTISFHGG